MAAGCPVKEAYESDLERVCERRSVGDGIPLGVVSPGEADLMLAGFDV